MELQSDYSLAVTIQINEIVTENIQINIQSATTLGDNINQSTDLMGSDFAGITDFSYQICDYEVTASDFSFTVLEDGQTQF